VVGKSQVDCTRDNFELYLQRLSAKEWDWSTFAQQGELKPELKRAQIRMVGGSITGVHDEPGTIPAEHFTVSFMRIPPGNLASSHAHPDTEEGFFVLEGEALAWWENAETGEVFEAELGRHDMIMSPAHVMHGIKNIGQGDLVVQVLIGAKQPEKPYFLDDDLANSQYAVHGRKST
jgi:mannose-6-phosphate isomerase-like protein (cupin superfamily)